MSPGLGSSSTIQKKTFPFSFSLQGRGLGASPLNDSSRTRDSFLVDSGLFVFWFENSFDIEISLWYFLGVHCTTQYIPNVPFKPCACSCCWMLIYLMPITLQKEHCIHFKLFVMQCTLYSVNSVHQWAFEAVHIAGSVVRTGWEESQGRTASQNILHRTLGIAL